MITLPAFHLLAALQLSLNQVNSQLLISLLDLKLYGMSSTISNRAPRLCISFENL